MLFLLSACHKNSVKDVDGNVYKTVTIGKQVWMAENLKTTKLNDGSGIPLVTEYDSWLKMKFPAYCWYENDSSNKYEWGAFYNWYTVNTNKLCPTGWHVPTYEDWQTLKNNSKLPGNAGGELKEAGTSHWKTPNTGANNSSGFDALPGGYRSYNGTFNYIRIAGYWWSSSKASDEHVYFMNLQYKSGLMNIYYSEKQNGFCVRCLKN